MKYLLFTISLLFFQYSVAQKLSSIGNWTENFNAVNIGNAGLDYDANYTSLSNQTRISVQSKGGRGNSNKIAYTYIHKNDIEWHEDLILEARLTSQVHGNNSGTSFQTINNFSQVFFYSTGKVSNIPIQYRISGISVTLPVTSYTTEVVFTILDY